MDIKRTDLTAVRRDGQPRGKPRVRRSIKFDLKDANQRLKFLGAIVSICLWRLAKYKEQYPDIIEFVCRA